LEPVDEVLDASAAVDNEREAKWGVPGRWPLERPPGPSLRDEFNWLRRDLGGMPVGAGLSTVRRSGCDGLRGDWRVGGWVGG